MEKEPPVPECFETEATSAERLIEMFVEMGQAKRTRVDPPPAQRAVFRKLHGVAHGYLERHDDMPEHMRVGIFAHQRLKAWMRFSSDTGPTSPDLGSTLGIGLKLFGVPGENALGEQGETADLIMQAASRFFVNDAKEMVEFTYAGVVQRNYNAYLARHRETNDILNAMTAPKGSVLTTTYWAILPFHLGDEIIKYRLEPETAPENVPDDATDYLKTDMVNRLSERDYRFVLSVQLRTNPDTMPLDKAMVEWPESESEFRPVATLVIPRQRVDARGQSDYGQNLSFNIWRVPPENRPSEESSIAVVRRSVYAAGAALRQSANGQLIGDPVEPRPVEPMHDETDDCIVQAVIYPSIGVARVGSSEEYFYGPEVIDPAPLPPGSYRDADKKLKRQAARFRIYGCNARGDIIRELTGEDRDAEIRWSVQLANQKAAWYGFQLALDIPEANYAPPTTLRNPGVADRTRLAITPEARHLQGAEAGPERFEGKFMDIPVYLGEISTDAAARLTVLGGMGRSQSYDDSAAITFANNEGWYDDVSDGPVTAEVFLDGQRLQVVPAWVVVAPPNYGPQRKSVRTMWDLMRDIAIKSKMLAAPTRPSFTAEILPIFERMAGLQWTNAGFAGGFGWEGAFDLTSREALAGLGSTSPAFREQRRVIYNNFRNFARDSYSPVPWPWLYGDAMNVPPADTPRQNAVLSDCQMAMLKKWSEGNFEPDYDPDRLPVREVDELPPAEQGEMLTRAALEFCLADAFHPGCEMTWPVRASSMYMAPFRFLHAPKGWIEPQQSEVLTTDSVTIPNGPLFGQLPGGITRWMAVPWQTDTSSCRSGYTPSYDPYVPSFWPARVPNEVLTRENYDIVMDTNRPMSERRKAFANREAWIEPLGADGYTHQINNMIQHFDFLGVVEVRDGPGDAEFPDKIEVEDYARLITPEEEHYRERENLGAEATSPGPLTHSLEGVRRRGVRSATEVDLSEIDLVNRFPRGLPTQR
ncbi:LodA/GoxA family CTQ-dependent oxidase [Hoeflea ulvae]|uniref:LodA/GoxA family CTQ-dependent oxidase n=1 Tax=Hoeflea ulvae TaxID=2983764 RepID=A0ABT3YIY4_9HYPH|nr:LodA/GoxA family CTQ-dependent oxidase [Hoeflea ulvae]MCY0095744.1 LodA/GoxA family CTQ-dependent oxidase [Hoeflea ulvae]